MIQTMSLFSAVILLFFTYGNLSEAKYVKKLPSLAVVYGTAYCDTCFQHKFPQIRHFISGASVLVECKDTNSVKISFRHEVKTNDNGEFKVHLPPYISKHVRKIKGCFVNLLSSNHPYCAVAASVSQHFQSGRNIFSEGFLTLKPMKEPKMCDQRTGVKNFKNLKAEKSSISNPNDPAFFPPIQDPTPPEEPTLGLYLPPLPLLPRLPPLRLLPRLPPLPGIPYLPPKKEAAVKPSQVVNNKGK